MTAEDKTWQELCVAASQESDSEQLLTLVSELTQARMTKANPTEHSSLACLAPKASSSTALRTPRYWPCSSS
jgi:hypothetical protein